MAIVPKLLNFYNDTSNGVYGLFLCRGDASIGTCQRCVIYAVEYIKLLCPSSKTVIIWFDDCMLSGYMAPEYAMHGQFSVKSDIFSFGVLVLEILSGQKNNCFRNGENVEDLLSYAWKNWREGTASNIVDPTISSGSTTEIMRCIHIALLCVQENVANRPTMASVVLMLNSYSITLVVPSEPAFFMHSNIDLETTSQWEQSIQVLESDERSKSNSVQASVNEASITELYPR
ncbi:cysteine-rich receptor-like protein kinase 10 [Corylus avellana]|uniref:cysteine-rich receptor-like protein kinase 10 n=1 Tax=Corylus avellana TaxID=13451 RepID=UPI00286C7DDE|nr:cysteine-rich receptor-like protein kinase 10 [Corylus avellana]